MYNFPNRVPANARRLVCWSSCRRVRFGSFRFGLKHLIVADCSLMGGRRRVKMLCRLKCTQYLAAIVPID